MFLVQLVQLTSADNDEKLNTLYSFDGIVSQYIEDEKGDFKLNDGTHLSGDELLQYLKKSNRALTYKAELYRKKYVNSEMEIGEIEVDNRKKLALVRDFYQNKIFSSQHSRSVRMLKRALENQK